MVTGMLKNNKPRFSHKDSSLVKVYYRVYNRVLTFFEGDECKARDWMFTDNMWFGGLSPINMIDSYRGKKLEDWIVSQLDDNDIEPMPPLA